MEILGANGVMPKLIKSQFGGQEVKYAFSMEIDPRINNIATLFNEISNEKKEIILSKILNVQILWIDYQKRWKYETELVEDMKKGGTKLKEYQKKHWLINGSWGNEDIIPMEELKTIPVNFGTDSATLISCLDITEITNNYTHRKEYYHTPEVIEVLQKWKEALQKWNNPEEREKMIEEYEREHSLIHKVKKIFKK